MAETYYARRSAVDPEWREEQRRQAADRARRRREKDPKRVRALARAKCARYRERLRRDPERLAAFRAKAAERERARRAEMSDEERAAASRAAVERERRRREKQTRVSFEPKVRAGLTFEELRERIPSFGERASLRTVLRDEVRSGRVLLVGGRYVLNGGLPEDVKRALLDLVDDRR